MLASAQRRVAKKYGAYLLVPYTPVPRLHPDVSFPCWRKPQQPQHRVGYPPQDGHPRRKDSRIHLVELIEITQDEAVFGDPVVRAGWKLTPVQHVPSGLCVEGGGGGGWGGVRDLIKIGGSELKSLSNVSTVFNSLKGGGYRRSRWWKAECK